MIKRIFDLVVSLIGLVILSPFFLILAILIKLDSSGPVFHCGLRVSKDGKLLKIWKFRTMVAGAEKMGPPITYSGDPRVTRLGRLLRRTKLDELPQLFNVLKGELSLVGPRPEAPSYVERYTPEQKKVLLIKPGITGLAQIRFRDEESLLKGATLDDDYINKILPQKLVLDMEYAKKQSFSFDLKILLKTILIVLKMKGLQNR